MRPLHLSIQGIRSFKEKQQIDFEWLTQNRLFGIFGNTGSGKSTILSSIIIAIYGKPDDGVVVQKDFITAGSDTAEVCFLFEMKGVKYVITRSFKINLAKGTSDSKAKLTQIVGDSELVLASSTREVNEKAEEIIGLSISEFIKCVVLPQGEFASFLTATAAVRLEIIGKLFDLEQYGQQLFEKINRRANSVFANISEEKTKIETLGDFEYSIIEEKKQASINNTERIKNYKNELEILTAHLQSQSKIKEDLDLLNKNKAELEKILMQSDSFAEKETIKQRHERAEKIADHLKELTEEQKGYRQKEENFSKQSLQLADLEKNFINQKTEFDSKSKNLSELADAFNNKISTLTVLMPTLSDLEKKQGLRQELINRYKTLRDAKLKSIEDKNRVVTELTNTKTELIDCTEKRENLDKIKEELEKNTYLSGREFEAIYAENILADKDIKLSLHFKDRVKEINLLKGESFFSTADFNRDEYTKLQKKEEFLKSKVYELEKNVIELDGKIKLEGDSLDKLQVEGENLGQEIKNIKDRLIENSIDFFTIAEFNQAIKELELSKVANENKKQDLEQNFKNIENNLQQAKTAKETAFGVLESAKLSYLKKQNLVSEFLKKENFSSSQDAISALLEIREYNNLKQEIEKFNNDKLILTERVDSLEKKTSGQEFSLQEFERALAKKELLAQNLENLSEENILLVKEIENLSERKEKLVYSKEKLKILEKEHNTARVLAELVKGKKLMEYVAEEFLNDITSGANVHISKLSGGRYLLSYADRDFYVKDNYSGGRVRKVSTLSGGETFLISLSLAIALSEAIARRSDKAIEFFFLDEGFGTLDKDLCDTVIQSLENLKDSHFTIGLISHVPELIRRMEYKLMVSPPSEENGSRVYTSGF